MDGMVQMYNEDKGFGFISCDGKNIFFHISDVKKGKNSIGKGLHVRFEIGENEKGEKAINVEIINEPKFIAIGDVRLKMSNIKEYGISTGEPKYKSYVYSLEPYDGNSERKAGLIETILGSQRKYMYVLQKTTELVDVNDVIENGDGTWECSIESAPIFYNDEKIYCKKWEDYEAGMRLHAGYGLEPTKPFVAYNYRMRKIIKHDSFYGHVFATKCEFIKGDFLLRSEDFVELEPEEYLYITTYQDDNYTFGASNIDIKKQVALLDNYFSV